MSDHYFCPTCKDTGIDPKRSECACGGFTHDDYQNFYAEIAQEMVLLGKTELDAKKLVEDRIVPKGPHWLLFHNPPEHWAKLVVLGNGYWRKKSSDLEI